MDEVKQYAHRDLEGLDAYYHRHVTAMTSEGLHSKARIAAELAVRDAEIDKLKALQSGEPVVDRDGYNTWSNSDGDTWLESPKDIEFVHGLKVGDTYELLAGWVPVLVEYRVTKAPDDVDDDYEVELLSAGKETV